jgi:hypothetical protein
MRQLLVPFLVLLFITPGKSQEPIPTPVETAFSESFPHIEAPFWEKREGAFSAMFADEEGLKKAFFNESGDWLETRIRQDREALPLGVQKFIDDHYQDAYISYMGVVETPDGLHYRVESELSSQIVIKLLTEAGELQEEKRIALSTVDGPKIIAAPLMNGAIRPIPVEKK